MKRVAFALVLAAVVAAPAEAIPAFARKHHLTCMACHDPIPRLTAFGEHFAANGFALSDDDTTGMTTLGDPLLLLNTTLPIAVRFDAYARYVSGQGGYTDFATPWVAKLLTGGQVSRSVSYYVYFLLAERGETGPVEDAWLMFREPLGVPADLTVGQFQVVDPLWKREARITLEDYAILSERVGDGAARLTYDRGIIVGAAPFAGTALFGEVVNGNGIGAAEDGQFDGDAPKTFALMGTQAIGPLTVGLLSYYGQQRLIPDGETDAVTNTTRMIGPMARLSAGPVDLGAQYVYRDDTDPTFTGTDDLTITRGGFAEALWWPQGRGGRLLVTGLYNLIQRPGDDYQTATANLSWLAARNLRLAAEGTWDIEMEQAHISLGFVTAF